MSGMLSIGISGLNTANVNLATVSHNISNSDTDGYSRQNTVQASNIANATGVGYIGQGSHVTTVERNYNAYLTRSLNSAQTKASSLDSYYTEISKIDNMLSEANAGLATALDGFFTGVSDAATNPGEPSSRQSMISSAQSLTSRYQALDGQLEILYSGVNTQITSTVDSINTYSKQIASLNHQIVTAQAVNGQPANDLLDQRDQMVAELNKLVAVTTSTQSNGSYDVYYGNGQQLVVGTHVSTLVTLPSTSDASRVAVGFKSSNGTIQEVPESLISGGTLGGLLDFRSEALDKTSNQLGLNATALAMTFNAQYALGQDADGAIAGESGFEKDFFDIPTTGIKAIGSNAGSPEILINLSPVSYDADKGSFYTNLTGSDYSLLYDGTNYTLTDLSGSNGPWSASTIADLNTALGDSQGFSLTDPATAPAAGTSYQIRPTRGAAGEIGVNSVVAADTQLLPLAAPIRTATGTGNTGSATISKGSVLQGYTAPAEGSPISFTYNAAVSPAVPTFTVTPNADVTVTISGNTPPSTVYPSGTDVPYTSGSVITVSGIVITISGTPANGDSFTIERNSGATSDSRNALALAALQTADTVDGGNESYSENYATLVSYIGNKTNELSVTSDAQVSLVTQASDAVASFSGVNLDEEAANLIKYQKAYQACARIITVASELFDTILALKS